MKEERDLLSLENDEKDKLIAELDIEVRQSKTDADFHAQNV